MTEDFGPDGVDAGLSSMSVRLENGVIWTRIESLTQGKVLELGLPPEDAFQMFLTGVAQTLRFAPHLRLPEGFPFMAPEPDGGQ